MNSNKFNSFFLLLSVVGLMLSTSAFAQQAVAEPAVTPAADVEAIANQALAEEVNVSSAEDTAEVLDPAMQIPVDGSSLEAFNESLATIKETAQELDYISLENAIQYLLVYDLGAGRDLAKVAKNLDGLTGDQIIGKVQWRK